MKLTPWYFAAIAPIAVAVSYVFHVIFERPFVSTNRKRIEQRFAAEM